MTTRPARTKKAAAAISIRKASASPTLSGEVTYVRIPVPARSSMNKKRPISDLVKAQLQHIHHAERARVPEHKRDDQRVKKIRTEAQAASYIAAVTKVLHPKRKPASASPARRKSGK